MEARLVSARVQDLLDDAMVRLSRLIEQEELSAEVATAVRETLVAVTSGRDSIASARRTL